MQLLFTRRAAALGLVYALLAGLAAAPASARHWPPFPIGQATVRGTITTINATAGSLQVTTRNGLSVTLTTNTETTIRRDGRTATLADLRTNDEVVVFYNRDTLVASRIDAATPAPIDLTGTITALDAAGGTIQVTTDHGTAVTLTANADTRIRLNNASTTLPNLVVGQRARVTYRPENLIALTLTAVTPEPGVVTGVISALDLNARTLQVTPLAGAPTTVNLTNDTRFRLNGRTVSASTLAVGQLVTVESRADGSARVVSARTPPLIDLSGTITALDVTGGTFQVTTPAMTTITLRLGTFTTVQRDGGAAAPDRLVMGDRVVVRYEYLQTPGASRALRITATSAPVTPSPTTPTVTLGPVTLNPVSVAGGSPSTGTVALSGAAPSGGTTVTLTSSNPAAATVPASVTVAEGATSATFPITTTAVTADTAVTISASFGGATNSATLTVTTGTAPPPTGPTVASLTVNPTILAGGTPGTATLTLSGAAPAGGLVISLTSSNPAVATVPASVTVEAGATSVTFPITTSAVTADTPVIITATLGTASSTATLTVTPAGGTAPV